MTALRQIITTTAQMTTLRDSIKNTFTAGQTAQFLSSIVTDPKIIASLDKAIGSKQDKPLKARQADNITAHMLGFHNANEMFDFYKNQRFFTCEQYIHRNRHEDCIYDIHIEEGVNFSVIDAIALFAYDIELDRDESFDWVSGNQKPVSLESIADDHEYVSASDNATGILFDLVPAHFNEEMHFPELSDQTVGDILDRVESYVDHAGNGAGFQSDPEGELGRYRADEFDTFSIPQAAMTSKSVFVQHLLDTLLGNNVAENVILDPVRPFPFKKDDNIAAKGIFSLNKDMKVVYDIERMLMVITNDKRPVLGGGLYLTKTDPRGKALRQLTQ